MDVGRILFSEPVVAGFDATGDWHDGGNGRYAKPGWSTAKRAILGLVRGAFARDHAKNHDGPVRVTFRPDTAAATLRNLGAAVDRTVHVRYHSNEHGVINVDGRDRLVRWDMFTDTLPPPSVPVTQNMVDRGIAGGLRSLNTTPDNPDLIDRLTANAETMFTLDLDGGYTTAAQAEITILNSTRIADRNRADIEIVGQILNKDGDEIGEFDRVITANKFTGEVSILHETLSLDTKHQGNGVGTRFIQRTVEQYAAEGILRVNTHGSSSTESAYDAGAYVWARAGFDWDLRGVSERSVFLRSAEKVARNLEKPGDPPDGMDPEDAATVRAAGRDMAGRLRTLMGNVRDGHTDLTGMVTPFDVASVGTDRWPIGKQAMSTSNPYARTPSGMSMVDFMYTKDLVEHPDAFQAPVTQQMVLPRSREDWVLDQGYNPDLVGTLDTVRWRRSVTAVGWRVENVDGIEDDDDIRRELTNMFEDAARDVMNDRVMVRVHGAVLPEIIEAGRLKSQHESGRSAGMFDPRSRFAYETDVFGMPDGFDVKRTPVYGLVASDTVATGAHGQYGDVGFLLKGDRIADRTSLSAGDSLFEAFPVPVPSVSWTGAGDDTAGETLAQAVGFIGEAIIEDRANKVQSTFTAVEAQIHGGVTLDDVAGIVTFSDASWGDATELANKLGVPIFMAPDSEGEMSRIRPGVKTDGDTEALRRQHGRTTYGDVLDTPVTQDMVVHPDVTEAAYVSPGLLRWAKKLLADGRNGGDLFPDNGANTVLLERAIAAWESREWEVDDPAGAYGLMSAMFGRGSTRRWVEQTLRSPNPDPDAVEALQQAHEAAADELDGKSGTFIRLSKEPDPFAAGKNGVTSWWRRDGRFDTEYQDTHMSESGLLGDHATTAEFDATRVLANIGGVSRYGEYLIAENPDTIDRLMSDTFPIAPGATVTQDMADRPVDLLFTDTTVNRIMAEYEAGGHDIQIVGGAIRSVLNGEIPNDMDLTTSATPEQSKALLASVGTVFPLGEKFGTVVVNVDGMDYEVTTYRTEIYDPVSRKPEVVFTKNLLEDLARRDFTFNAMAVGTDRNIIDPYGGANDLANKVVKAVGDPDERFTEDPLRIIRAVRFASVLGFTIDPETLAAARRNADRLDVVSTERFGGELNKILKSDVPGVIPQAAALAETVGAGDALFGPLLPAALRHKDVPAEHRFASLVYDAHRVDGVDPATLVDRMKRGRVEIRDIETVIKAADSLRGGEDPRLLVRRNTDQTLERLRVLDPGLWTSDLDRAYQDRVVLRAPLPVDGNDMKALGFEGAEIRTALGTVERLFVNGNSAMTRQEALDAVKPSATQQMVDVPYQIGAPADPATRVRVAQRNRSLIEQHHAALVSEMDDAMPLEEFVSEVVAGLDNMRAAGDPTIRVPWGAVPGIVADGRFKSQHETGVSSAAYVPGHRVSIEHSALGVPRDINPAMRPIFGVLEDTYEDGANGADAYGPVSFLLKRDVLNRSTMSFGDSGDLDVVPVRVTGDVTDDELLAAASDRTVNDVASAVQADALETDMWEGADMNEPGFYREIQIHGGLTLSDVLDVTYIPDEDQPETATAIQALTDAGLTPVTQWMAERPPTIAVGEPWPVDQIRHVDGGTFPVAKRTVQLPGGRTVNITDVGGDSQDGYYSATNVMFDAATGERMGHLSYSVGKGDLNIRMVETNPQFRREGVADALLSYTLVNSPDAKVNPGSLTDNGADWWPHVLSWLPDANKPDAPVTQNMVDRPDRTPDYFYEMDIAPVPDGVVQIGTEYLGDPSEPGGVIARTMWETSARPVETAAREVRADRIEVAIPSSTVEAVISAGRLMSQHESKSSRGMYDPELRRRVESRYFGIPGSHPKVDMPIYGFVAEAGTTPSIYGGVILRMKPAVAERTTVTFGDSLLTSDVTILRPAPVVGLTDATVSALKQATPPREFYRNNDYVEAQIHGGVRIRDDVDTVVLRGTFHDENTIAALQLADHLGVPLTVDRTVHRQIHRRNMESALKQHPELAAVTVQYESPDYMLGDPATPREDQYVLQLLGSPYTIDDVRNLLKDGSLTDTQRHDLNMILLQLEVP